MAKKVLVRTYTTRQPIEDKLTNEAKLSGLAKSQIIQRALDAYLDDLINERLLKNKPK